MPCSRSARSPSVNNEKSTSPAEPPVRVAPRADARRTAESWSSKIPPVSWRSRPISVDLPSSTEPITTMRRSSFCSCLRRYCSTSSSISWASEVAFTLLHFHRAFLVVIDEAALTLAVGREQHLADDRRQRGRVRTDRARQRIAAERPEPHHLGAWHLAGAQPHALVVDHDQRALAVDHRPRRREVQRHDRDVLEPDVLPDVELGPVGQRERADGLALLDLAVVE